MQAQAHTESEFRGYSQTSETKRTVNLNGLIELFYTS